MSTISLFITESDVLIERTSVSNNIMCPDTEHYYSETGFGKKNSLVSYYSTHSTELGKPCRDLQFNYFYYTVILNGQVFFMPVLE